MLWILKGAGDAPGWKDLLTDAKEEKIDWRLLDRDGFVIVRGDEAPKEYDGLTVGELPDGLYADQQGNHLYIVDREEVAGHKELFAALGEKAEKMYEEIGDPLVVLQRLGKSY